MDQPGKSTPGAASFCWEAPGVRQPDFCWAAGIEDTFIPQARPGLRALEEYELTQHYQQWQGDFDRAAETCVQALRWGVPWYRVQPAIDRWDWRWVDAALEYLVVRKGITPILDLMHYGTPTWLDNSFLNAGYPYHVAAYAQAVVERYAGLVKYITPLNEPVVNAEFCGQNGQWPPYLKGHDGFVKVLCAVARGIVLTMQALQSCQGLKTVQVEALWHNWTVDPRPEVQARVARGQHRQYLCYDLVTGQVDERHPLHAYVLEHGIRPEDLDWFRSNRVCFDVFGANFYPWSFGELVARPGGSLVRCPAPTPGSAIQIVLEEACRRTGLPVMVTETSANAPLEGRAAWMDETIAAVCGLRREGLPLVGYTWFPLLTMINWDYRTGRRPLKDYLLHLGLYDSAFDARGVLERHATPLVARYRSHIQQGVPEMPVLAPRKVSVEAAGPLSLDWEGAAS